MAQPLYYSFWGKAAEGDSYHLLPYHSLDVAAVGGAFLRSNRNIRRHLSQMLAISAESLDALAVFFLGLHDLGKFSPYFQSLRPDLLRKLHGNKSEYPYVRHDVLGEVFWRSALRPHCVDRGLLDVEGGRRRISYDTAADYWLHTVLGHHGKPVSDKDSAVREVPQVYFPAATKEAATRFFDEWVELCGLENGVSLPSAEAVKRASWWLAGLAVLCDWLGSNQVHFPLEQELIPLAEYWERAQEQADQAIVRSGVVPAATAPIKGPEALFGDRFDRPTPLQEHCLALPVEAGPGLYLLEDVTGAGKTEAALILAHRLMVERGARGLYFALPSMATANAMFERMGQVYRRLYADDAAPSLVLAHGARRLHRGFRDAIEGYPLAANHDYGDGTEPAQSRCAAWLADNPKKSLLAEVGVGTIDQAVLGVLPSRHQSLRLLGLLGKVLIVDEVHAYDAYLFNLLKALITFHTASGGTTILLSATLPQRQRQALLDAHHDAVGKPRKPVERVTDKAYPLLTRAAGDVLHETVLASRPEVCRTVAVERIDAFAQAEALMERAIAQGQCLCWIRNTVHDARQAWRELKGRHPEWELDLFHARYALGDRLVIEERVVSRFGKRGGEAERKGQILIATPVVEQSLDLDFDWMIVDLSPIDLILQRAGRLHRHRRDQSGNIIDGDDRRGTPTLHLYAPEPVDEPDVEWFSTFLPKAAYVYPNHARLWLGLRLLMAKNGFTMPDDARPLIEGVYGSAAEFPPGLEASDITYAGEQSGEASLADYNALSVSAHYGETHGGRWWSEERAPTRLGDSTPIYLARMEGEAIVPLRSDGEFPWQLSSLSVLRSKIAAVQRPASVTEAQWERAVEQLPAQGRWGVLLLLDENAKGSAANGRGETVSARYCRREGLVLGGE